jgi:type I restriction enzyme M protein
VLSGLAEQLRAWGYDRLQPLPGPEAGAVAWGANAGAETPRIFLLPLVDTEWSRAAVEFVQECIWARMPPETPDDAYPQFAVAGDGTRHAIFDLSYPPHQLDRLPPPGELAGRRAEAAPTYRWSMRMYGRLMRGFNAFHEQVYQTVKDRVNGKNDIILEVAKFLFLESFRLHHRGDSLPFPCGGRTLLLGDVFAAGYVRRHGVRAVAEIQAAFDHFKAHPDYVVRDDHDRPQPIFDAQTHLLLAQPRNHEALLDLIQDLPPVTDNRNRVVKERGDLADVAADVLGRAFDVFLRANFDGKGGLGIYLTPAPVKQAMLAVALHDIATETPELLTARGADGAPAFRFCDPACGSYGFGVVALGYLERALRASIPDNPARAAWLRELCAHSFVGADAAPLMVTLARVNMALLGAPRARILHTQNALVSDQLRPCSFDLVCTNPPFGTPKFGRDQAEARRGYERDMEAILREFRSDLRPLPGRRERYRCAPTVAGLALGGAPDRNGVWKPVGASIDPAVLFLDRCLQLLKPGGRLLIVLPDGVLCNATDQYVREYLLGTRGADGQFRGGKALVRAVISLPVETFRLSGTGAKASIVYLQKRKARPDDPQRFLDEPQPDVFMAVAASLGYVVRGNVEDYGAGVPNDLAAIAGAYCRGE